MNVFYSHHTDLMNEQCIRPRGVASSQLKQVIVPLLQAFNGGPDMPVVGARADHQDWRAVVLLL